MCRRVVWGRIVWVLVPPKIQDGGGGWLTWPTRFGSETMCQDVISKGPEAAGRSRWINSPGMLRVVSFGILTSLVPQRLVSTGKSGGRDEAIRHSI